jgi:dihydrofolate reductase
MSRKIIVAEYMSLDGVVEDPVGMEDSGLGNWTGPFARGPEGDQFKLDELRAGGALLLGRNTYEAFAAAWTTRDDEAGFAERMNSLPKFVASTTLKAADWNNSAILTGDLADGVRALKAQPGGDILVYGSASLVHALMPLGLIDQYNLMVYPTVLGRGKRLFPDGVATRLALLECRQFGGGIVLARYQTEDSRSGEARR